jgi:hypothetical protein
VQWIGTVRAIFLPTVLGAIAAACAPVFFGAFGVAKTVSLWLVVVVALVYLHARYCCKGNRHGGTGADRGVSVADLFVVLALSVCVSWYGWSSHRASATTGDELCMINQARAFAGFSVTLPLDTFGKYIDPTTPCFIKNKEGFYSVQAPGWAAVLAAFRIVGVPDQSVTWLLASVSLFLVGILGLYCGGLAVGAMSILSLAHNQFFDEMSKTLWAHPACMLFLSAALALLVIYPSFSPRYERKFLIAIGALLGLMVLTRPLTGVSAAVGVFIIVAVRCRGRSLRWMITSLALLALGPAIAAALYGLFNHLTTGDVWLNGYEVVHGPGHNPGFNRISPAGVAHTPERAVMLLHHHVRHLLQFVVPSPWCFFGALAVLVVRGCERHSIALLLVLITIWLGAATYWSSSYFVGPRFYYESLVPLTVLISVAGWRLVDAVFSFLPLRSYYIQKYRNVLCAVVYVALMIFLLPAPPVR